MPRRSPSPRRPPSRPPARSRSRPPPPPPPPTTWAQESRLCTAALAVKGLLSAGYASTDLEVHRHWLALTHTLPLSAWYTDTTSTWTLDYPPLFAYVTRWLAGVARVAAPAALTLSPTPISTPGVVAFLRGSVLATDALLWGGARYYFGGLSGDTTHHFPALVWLLLNVPLITVDNIHFQYNGALLAGLLVVYGLFARGKPVAGLAAYVALVHLKHTFLTLAPVVAAHVLGLAAAAADAGGAVAGGRLLVQYTAGCAAVVGSVWLPLVWGGGRVHDVVTRLFPFHRGLVHEYWAGNVWALYLAGGRGLGAFRRVTGWVALPTALPDVSPGVCAALCLVGMAPLAARAWSAARAHPASAGRSLAPLASACAGVGFLLGYHVHEKAALQFVLPWVAHALCLHGRLPLPLAALALAAGVGVMPLLYTPREQGWAVAALAAHLAGLLVVVVDGARGWLLGLGAVLGAAHCVWVVAVLSGAAQHAFLPLLLVSVACAGVNAVAVSVLGVGLWRGRTM